MEKRKFNNPKKPKGNSREENPDDVNVIMTRHSLRPDEDTPDSDEFPGITEEGVELAKERARDIVEQINQLPLNSTVFLGSVSYRQRTRSTMQVYADEVERLLENGEDNALFSEEGVAQLYEQEGGVNNLVDRFTDIDAKNKSKRLVVEQPLALKEMFSQQWFGEVERFDHDDENLDDAKSETYIQHLRDAGTVDGEISPSKMFDTWLKERGVVDGKKIGPSPEDIAKSYLNAIERMKRFVKKATPDREISIVMVGHSVEADAFLAYMVGQGVVDNNAIEKLNDKNVTAIRETEMAVINIDDKGQVKLTFRGKEFEADLPSAKK